jgi:dihydrolipoamide dehydrogenase
MTEMRCDVAIIGAGTAGLAAERAARKAGVKTLLIDEGFRGTTCAAVGCMPSTLLIAAANAAHAVRRSSIFGMTAVFPTIDGSAVMDRLRKERDDFVGATLKTMDRIPRGVRIMAKARFVDRTRLELDDGKTACAKAVVVAMLAR